MIYLQKKKPKDFKEWIEFIEELTSLYKHIKDRNFVYEGMTGFKKIHQFFQARIRKLFISDIAKDL